MTGKIAWKLVLAVLIVAWALASLLPVNDTPFDEYIVAVENGQGLTPELQAEWEALLEQARENVRRAQELAERDELTPREERFVRENSTLFVSLRSMGRGSEPVDFAKYFPEIDLRDVKNTVERNEILLQALLERSQGNLNLGLDLQGGVSFTFKIDEEDASEQLQERAEGEVLDKAVDVMRGRIDAFGVTEPVIRPVGQSRLEVQLPGATTRDNPDLAETISAPALLEFREVNMRERPQSITDEPPVGFEIMVNEVEDPRTGEVERELLYVKVVPEATGEIIDVARPAPTGYGGWQVLLTMTGEGGDILREVTSRMIEGTTENNRPRLAIVLDGKLYSAPALRDVLSDSASITGNFTQREAIELANVLNNPLEVGLEIDEMTEVGPSLAEDARESSVNAALWGAALVIVFMAVFYLGSGAIAIVSVLASVTIVIGTLASLGATITLPGVAALVLTIGMAVDAQILIFERIREESRAGKSVKNALVAGYEKAFSTIVDANVTTLITALILIWLGTGPVKGFGYTLAIGIVASMFCALILTRGLLEILVYTGVAKRLIPWRTISTKASFLSYRKPAFVASWCIVLAGVITVAMEGKEVLGIDFLGGSEITATFEEEIPFPEIEQVAAENNLGEVIPSYETEIGSGIERLVIQTEGGNVVPAGEGQGYAAAPEDATMGGEVLTRGTALVRALNAAFPEANLNVVEEMVIGAAVSTDVTFNAVTSVLVALVGILLYVAVRFEFGYGIGAVVATVHDVLMTIGIFVILGLLGVGSGQFTAPMVAAILMIVGYSINDTIVVFDRIREELDLNPNLTLMEVTNLAINRTLSRTLLTSLTTFLAAGTLFLFGAGVIIDFSLVFLIGILTGTFSSIFIASPVFYWWHKGDRGHVTERELLPKYEWETTTRAAERKPGAAPGGAATPGGASPG